MTAQEEKGDVAVTEARKAATTVLTGALTALLVGLPVGVGNYFVMRAQVDAASLASAENADHIEELREKVLALEVRESARVQARQAESAALDRRLSAIEETLREVQRDQRIVVQALPESWRRPR